MKNDLLLRSDDTEGFKAAVHMAAFGLAVSMFLYNLGSWCARRKWHLAVNAVIYGSLAGFEVYQTCQHRK